MRLVGGGWFYGRRLRSRKATFDADRCTQEQNSIVQWCVIGSNNVMLVTCAHTHNEMSWFFFMRNFCIRLRCGAGRLQRLLAAFLVLLPLFGDAAGDLVACVGGVCGLGSSSVDEEESEVCAAFTGARCLGAFLGSGFSTFPPGVRLRRHGLPIFFVLPTGSVGPAASRDGIGVPGAGVAALVSAPSEGVAGAATGFGVPGAATGFGVSGAAAGPGVPGAAVGAVVPGALCAVAVSDKFMVTSVRALRFSRSDSPMMSLTTSLHLLCSFAFSASISLEPLFQSYWKLLHTALHAGHVRSVVNSRLHSVHLHICWMWVARSVAVAVAASVVLASACS